uniref:Uncharacterized protein n=1 Tax=Romanomermis culicivorax TaxID=13658 RepID=A0A915IY39_ROMCU
MFSDSIEVCDPLPPFFFLEDFFHISAHFSTLVARSIYSKYYFSRFKMIEEILEKINTLFASPTTTTTPAAHVVPDFVQRSFSVDDSRMNITPGRSSAKNLEKSDENLKNDGGKNINHVFGDDGHVVVTMRDGLKCSGDQFFSSGGCLAPYEYEREAFEIIFKSLQKM